MTTETINEVMTISSISMGRTKQCNEPGLDLSLEFNGCRRHYQIPDKECEAFLKRMGVESREELRGKKVIVSFGVIGNYDSGVGQVSLPRYDAIREIMPYEEANDRRNK